MLKKKILLKLISFINLHIEIFLEKTLNIRIVKIKHSPDLSVYQINKLSKNPLYLNVGAGRWYHPFWHNLDNPRAGYDKSSGYNYAKKNLIIHDLMNKKKIPIKNNSLKAIYISHTIEHLNFSAIDFLLRECYRILKPNGFLRIVAPDLNFYMKMYNSGNRKWLQNAESIFSNKFSNEQYFLGMFASSLSKVVSSNDLKKISSEKVRLMLAKYGPEETLNKLYRLIPKQIVSKHPRHHDSWHTEKSLINRIKKFGFSEVYSSRYLQSRCLEMQDKNYFDQTHPELSLFVEVIK